MRAAEADGGPPVNMALVAQLPGLNSQIERNLQAMIELHGLFQSLVHYRSKYAKKIILDISKKVYQIDEVIGDQPSTVGLAIRQIKDTIIEEAGFLEREAKQIERDIMGEIIKLSEDAKVEKKTLETEFDRKKKIIENGKLQVAKKRKDCFMAYEQLYAAAAKMQEARLQIPREPNPQKKDILVGSIAKSESLIKKLANDTKKMFIELERLCVDVNLRYRVFYGEDIPAFMESLRKMDEKRVEQLKEILHKFSNLTTESMKTVLDRRRKMDEMIRKVVGLDDSMLYVSEFSKERVVPELPLLRPELPIESAQIDGRIERLIDGDFSALVPLSPVERASGNNFLSNILPFFSSPAPGKPATGANASPAGVSSNSPSHKPNDKFDEKRADLNQSAAKLAATFQVMDSSGGSKGGNDLKDNSEDEDEPRELPAPKRDGNFKSAASVGTTSSTIVTGSITTAQPAPKVKNLFFKPDGPVAVARKPAPLPPSVRESIGAPMIIVDEKVAELMKLPPPPPPPEEDAGLRPHGTSVEYHADDSTQSYAEEDLPQSVERTISRVADPPQPPNRVDLEETMSVAGRAPSSVRSSFAVLKDAVALEGSEDYLAEDGSVLEFHQGDLLVITDQTDNFWWGGYLKSDEANNPEAKWFPADLVKLL
eukprot:TRINITY_DN861_c0_g1_i2.p1 TRINITY_DN861_c0_g1~~TRINITY_DN861_c0_g1_i2.p1  ORF type:complete len:666 (-),score=224.82 TRINITY_DN861_c0_g1_i2:3028-4986(-)